MKKLLIALIVCGVIVAGLVMAADITQTAAATSLKPPVTNQEFYNQTRKAVYNLTNTDVPAIITAVNKLDQLASLEIQTASITAPNSALSTNTFASAFTGVPVVTADYTEDPGDVRPIFISSVTASNVVFGITADKNYAYTAIYKP